MIPVLAFLSGLGTGALLYKAYNRWRVARAVRQLQETLKDHIVPTIMDSLWETEDPAMQMLRSRRLEFSPEQMKVVYRD